MTPRYTWTPASEPPDTDRQVLGWHENDVHFPIGMARYVRPWVGAPYWDTANKDDVTYWQDVAKPGTAEAEERFTLRQILGACLAVGIEEGKCENLLLELDALKWKSAEAGE